MKMWKKNQGGEEVAKRGGRGKRKKPEGGRSKSAGEVLQVGEAIVVEVQEVVRLRARGCGVESCGTLQKLAGSAVWGMHSCGVESCGTLQAECRRHTQVFAKPDLDGGESRGTWLGGWNRRALWLGVVVMLLLAVGCRRGEETKGRKPLVVCTTTIIADMAKEISGGVVQVHGLMKAGTDPHTYTPRPEDGMWLRKASLVLVNGLHLEGKLLDMIENAGKKPLALAEDPVIRTRQGMGLPDPHVWWDIRFFRRYVEKARDGLAALITEAERPGLEARAAAYLRRLDAADRWARESIQRIPKERRLMITSHDAFYYFGAAYGLEVDAVLGVSTEAQAKAAEPLRLADRAAKRKVDALFHETSVSKEQNDLVDSIQRLAWLKHKHRLSIAGPLYSDSLDEEGKEAGSYLGAFAFNVRTIVKALGGGDVQPPKGTGLGGSATRPQPGRGESVSPGVR